MTIDRNSIRWSEPPDDYEPLLHIVHADHTRVIRGVVLSRREVGVIGHWVADLNRNQPCIEPHGCLCETQTLPVWWRCYLAMHYDGKIGLAEITADAWRACRGEAVRFKRKTLRGLKIELDRKPRRKSGSVVCRLLEPVAAPDAPDLPVEPRVKRELERIWFSRL